MCHNMYFNEYTHAWVSECGQIISSCHCVSTGLASGTSLTSSTSGGTSSGLTSSTSGCLTSGGTVSG